MAPLGGTSSPLLAMAFFILAYTLLVAVIWVSSAVSRLETSFEKLLIRDSIPVNTLVRVGKTAATAAASVVSGGVALYGFAPGEKYSARDVWEGKDLGKVSEATGVVAAHGVLLLELKK